MVYNNFICDLIIATTKNEIFRFSLDDGRFLESFFSEGKSINSLEYNKYLNLLIGCG